MNNQSLINISIPDGFLLVRPEEIIRIETESSYRRSIGEKATNGDGNFTRVFLHNGISCFTRRQIGEWEKLLEAESSIATSIFFRCHQSHLVNLRFVFKIETKQGVSLLLKHHNEQVARVPVARRQIQELKVRIGI